MIKKTITILSSLMLLFSVFVPQTVMAEEVLNTPMAAPTLTSISFKNAQIDEEFSPTAHEYALVLDDPEITPTLENYTISGSAEIFVTYITDDSKHQTGIKVTLEYESGSVYYLFNYKNATAYAPSDNNYLESVECDLGEVYPAINDKDTDYKLYIPSDLTEITLTAITQELTSVCEVPGTITLNANQEPTLAITVTSSNGDTRIYNFKVKRLNKNTDEVKALMAEPDFKSIVQGELFYQKPTFIILIISVAAGLVLLLMFIKIAKRLTVRVDDEDEVDFFSAD
jgi:hypothetical protein